MTHLDESHWEELWTTHTARPGAMPVGRFKKREAAKKRTKRYEAKQRQIRREVGSSKNRRLKKIW